MTINTNTPALAARCSYGAARRQSNDALLRLATGFRVNRGKDDPAGLISSEVLRARLAELEAETNSVQRTSNIAATAEGALEEVSDLLIQANALALANANTGGLSDAERQANQQQLDAVVSSVTRIAGTTSFNGMKLLDGSHTLRSGPDELKIDAAGATNLGKTTISGSDRTLADVVTGGALSTLTDPANAQRVIGAALSQVATLRGKVGAFQKHALEPKLNSMAIAYERTADAVSRIRDADYARETAALVRARLLERSTARLLRISSTAGERVLGLLK